MRNPGIIAAQASAETATIVREYYAAEAAGPVTGSDASTNVQLVAMTETLGVGNWLILWTCELNSSDGGSLSSAAIGRIAEDGAEVDYSSLNGFNNTADWGSAGGFYIHAGTGAPVTFTIDVRSRSDLLSTIPSARNGRIIALKLSADDVWVENTASQSSSSTTPVDAATLSFTPPSSGDYLFIGYAQVSSLVSAKPKLQLTDGVLTSPEILINPDGGDLVAVTRFWVRSGLSAAQTISLQYWGLNAAGVSLHGARVLGLRLDGFTHAYRTVSNADEQGDDLTFTDSLALSRNVQDRDFLALASWGAKRASGSGDSTWESRFVDALGSVAAIDQAIRPFTPTPSNPVFAARVGAYSAGRKTWSIQRKSPDGDDALIDAGAAIAVLQLN